MMSDSKTMRNVTSSYLQMLNESSYVAGPPEFQSSDYGEIAVLAILIMVGAPLNLVSLFRTLRAAGYFDSLFSNTGVSFPYSPSSRRRLASQSRARESYSGKFSNGRPLLHQRRTTTKTNSRLLTFKLHLTCASLLIVFGYGFSQLIWLSTYSWRGGDILCKFIKFLHTFCFYATSNLVASIAIDRLRVTIHVDRPSAKPSARRASSLAAAASHAIWLRRLVWCAWMLAFASSVPQFFLWRTFAPFRPFAPDWHQCVTVWMATFYSDETNNLDASILDNAAYSERIYGALHLTLVFWIPISVIALCYALILTQLHRKIRKSNKDMRHLCKHRRESDALVFRQRCESMHRASICSAGSHSGSGKDASMVQELQPSAALLMELPIVVSSAQPFVCQPLLESFAVVTLTKAKRRTMKTTAWILVAYVACWSPYNVLELYRYLIDPEFENFYLQLLSNLIVLNAVVNPIIYGL